MFHFIFDYNYWEIVIIFTIGNRNEYSTKRVQTVSLQLKYISILPGKTKNNTQTSDRLLQCILLNWLFQTFADKSFNVRFFPCLIDSFFSSLLTENHLHSRGFYRKCTFKLNMANFNM